MSSASECDTDRLARGLSAPFEAGGAERSGKSSALLVTRGGRIVVEHYGNGIDPEATRRSGSMAKRVLHALVGPLVGDGMLDIASRAPVYALGEIASCFPVLQQENVG